MAGIMKSMDSIRSKRYIMVFYALFLSLFWLFIFKSGPLYAAEIVDRIVAQVNDDVVTLYDLKRSMVQYIEKINSADYTPEQKNKMLNEVMMNVLNDLIETKLTDKEVKEADITVDEKDIDNAIEQVKKMNFFTDEELKVALARDSMTLEGYRKNIREQLLRTKLVHQKVKSKIVITKAEINDYYQKNLDKYGGSKKYHLRSIIKKISAFEDEAKKKEIYSQMESILKELDKGESFELLAKRNSDLLSEEGGDLGMFSIDQIAPQVWKAISSIGEKEHTSIIETGQGYQIFYLQEIVEAGGKSLDDVRNEIEGILYKEKVNKKFAEWLESIKEKSYIKIIN